MAGVLACLQTSGAPINQNTDLHPLQTLHQDDRQEIELGGAPAFSELSNCLLSFQDQGSPAFFFLHLWVKLEAGA